MNKPLIVQSDKSILVEVDSPSYEFVRNSLVGFAELEKSPEYIHTYRLTPISLWNAAAAGLNENDILKILKEYSRYDVPQNVEMEIRDYLSRYGKVKLYKYDEKLILESPYPSLITEIWSSKKVRPYLVEKLSGTKILVNGNFRGHLKHAMIKIGYPVEDLAGYIKGKPCRFSLRDVTLASKPFNLRKYQNEAADMFYASGAASGGSGVVVLPCGAGKTIVGIAAMAFCGCHTLILVSNTTAGHQWINELLDKTSLTEDMVGEYSGEKKEIKPVTVSTYQILTYRKSKKDDFKHFSIFKQGSWGLVIYDEVHLLPAPVFRITAEIQAFRRLGLTATLVREDKKEDEVFSLIGPKKYDVPWKDLEKQGWIATAFCTEIRLVLPEKQQMAYAVGDKRRKFRLSSENPGKINLVKKLLEIHKDDQILVIGQYLDQLNEIFKSINEPIITGSVKNKRREELFQDFREGKRKILIVSSVANFALDLPEASVAIQISGKFGSRQEEAQRLGRILRPKTDGKPARFYTIVTRDTVEQDFAQNRQMFLTEQGYRYTIKDENSADFINPEMIL